MNKYSDFRQLCENRINKNIYSYTNLEIVYFKSVIEEKYCNTD